MPSDDATSTESETDPTESDTTDGPECVEQSDCPGGYSCFDGRCEYTCEYCCGAAATDGDVFRCSPYYYYECYSDNDCGDGRVCVDHECVPDSEVCQDEIILDADLELAFSDGSGDPIVGLQFAQLAPTGAPALIAAQGERVVRGDTEGSVALVDIDDVIVDLATFDADGDGDLDLVTVDGASVRTWRGLGDGTFDPVAMATAMDSVAQIELGDAQGDGIVDVFGYDSAGVWVFASDGAGGLAPGSLVYALDGIERIAVLDVDDDGVSDTATFGGSPYEGFGVLLGASLKWQALTPGNDPVSIVDFVAADFSGDGRVDLASLHAGDELQGWVAPVLGATPFRFDANQGVSGATAGDVDNNGMADLVSGFDQGVTIRYGAPATSDGAPPFACRRSLDASVLAQEVAVGDFDADGDADIAITDGNRVLVMRGAW